MNQAKKNKKILSILTSILLAIILYGAYSVQSYISENTGRKPIYTVNSLSINKVSNAKIQELIDNIDISEEIQDKYNRDDYSYPVKFYGLDKQTAREYSIYNKYNLTVNGSGFVYRDPYSSKILHSMNEVEYDHIIPLSYVNSHGGEKWSSYKKNQYCYDLSVGLDVSKSKNRQKSDSGPSEWLPEVNKKEYCYSWLVIANKYDISISKADMDVIKRILKNVKSIGTIN